MSVKISDEDDPNGHQRMILVIEHSVEPLEKSVALALPMIPVKVVEPVCETDGAMTLSSTAPVVAL
jgi:hypothetical protein